MGSRIVNIKYVARKFRLKEWFLLCLILLPFISFSQDVKIIPLPLVKAPHGAFGSFMKGDTMYFCTDLKRKSVKNVQNTEGQFLDLYWVRIKNKNKLLTKPSRVSDSINTKLNEGPLVISSDGNTLIYSKNIHDPQKNDKIELEELKLGLFTLTRINGNWSTPVPFEYNDNSINIAHPALSANGDLLIFSSDHKMGMGRTDLYMCKKVNGKWSEPMNLGDSINSESGETFPFIMNDKLYFASNRPGGLGGLDLYVSSFADGQWSKAVLLEAPINSEFDDFCIFITDAKSGYFSSNRTEGIDKIYYFEKKIPEPIEFIRQKFDFCYEFTDEMIEDTLGLEFEWDFGDGTKKKGLVTDHCFLEPGNYSVNLTIHEIYPDRYYSDAAVYDLVISANGLPVIEVEEKEDKAICSVNYKWSEREYDSHYWLVNNKKIFEESITVSLSKDQLIKLVLWNKKDEGSEVGIEYKIENLK